MSTCACVFSKSGKRLMPTIRLGKVRHLLKDGKAKIIKHHPFTIQLLYDSETNIKRIPRTCTSIVGKGLVKATVLYAAKR